MVSVLVLEAAISEFPVSRSVAEAVLSPLSRTRTVPVIDALFHICRPSSHLSNSSRSRACLANISSHKFLGTDFRRDSERMNHSVSRSARWVTSFHAPLTPSFGQYMARRLIHSRTNPLQEHHMRKGSHIKAGHRVTYSCVNIEIARSLQRLSKMLA